MTFLSEEHKRDLLKRGFTRRSFGRAATLMGAAASLPFYSEPAMAQLSMIGPMPPDAVKINANENPLGPCTEAMEAIWAASADAQARVRMAVWLSVAAALVSLGVAALSIL